MNFTSVTDRDEITWLQGYVDASYYELRAAFGEPIRYPQGDKVRVEWVLKFSDDTLATIYDWKEDRAIENVPRWNIGGRSPRAVECVQAALDETFMRLMEGTAQYDLDPYADMDDWYNAG